MASKKWGWSSLLKRIALLVVPLFCAAASPAFATDITFDYESGVTGFGTTDARQTLSGETLKAISVHDILGTQDDVGSPAISGTQSLFSSASFNNETSVTFSLVTGKQFNLTSISFAEFKAVAETVTLTSSKGTVTFNLSAGSTGSTFNVAGHVNAVNMQGVTSFTVTASPTNFMIGFDNIALQNITTAASPPTATTGSATVVSATGATLNGTINDNGADTTVTFDYGLTASYGTNVAATTGGTVTSGSGSTAVAKTVAGLTCNTTYHFRVKGVNAGGTTNGSDNTFTTSKCPQTITFTNPGAQNFGSSPTLSATATSSLTPTFSSSTTGVCTITGGGTLTFVTPGTCTIDADQAGNSTYAAAPTVSRSFTVNAVVPGAPTIGTATAGDAQASVTFTAPASSGGASITGYTAIASPGGATGTSASSPITVTGLTNGTAYTFTITADNSVGTGSSSSASNSVTPKGSQTITFTNPGAQNFGTSPTLSATATSSLTPTFTSSTTGVCTITGGGTLTFVTAGTCTIDADQAGNGTYNAAPTVSRSFTVNAVAPGAPTIGTATAGDTQASVAFTAPASNGGASITGYTATANPGGATGTGASSPIMVTGLTNGTAYTFTVTADNSVGTGSASSASNSVTPKGSQTITFTNPGAQNFGTSPTLSATATSSLTPTFTSSTTGVCTITGGGTLTFVTAGTCTIDADQAGNGTYNAAPTVSRSFTVNAVVPGAPTIGTATAGDTQASVAFTAPASTGGASITGYTATANPGGATGTSASSPITVPGLTNGVAYTFTVTADNSAGTGSASSASNSVTPRGAQTITFANPGAQNFGTSPTLTATSTSSLTVSFTSATTSVCTITTGGVLTFVTAGTCTINADQAGDGTYLAAAQVQRSFTVNAVVPGAPTIGAATAGDTQASIAFTAPASSGGASITGYTVTSNPGGLTGTGASSPVIVTGLTNGIAYTFTATATNGAGTGPASAASNSITPKASQTITFANPGAQTFGTSPTLTATSDSALTVSFSSSTTGVCTITSGGVLTFVIAGTCTINADQAGNGSYLAATQVSRSFTVNAVVPGAPTIGTATSGDAQASVNFTAPASTGGTSITSYTVTSTPGSLTGTGSASPITVTGLTNGLAYTFKVSATNGVGAGSQSAASNSVTPEAAVENPFNDGGTQTQGSLEPGSGITVTAAPADIVTNLGKLDSRVGISDNGVIVVLDNGLKEPVKFRDNPPDNVLISMPSQKPLDVQMNGNTMNIQIDPETPNPPRQTILSTTTLLLPNGTEAKGLQLVQGEAAIANSTPGGPLGGLELSKDTTLRGVVAQAGPEGGGAGFKKTLDGAGSVSAEWGEIRITVRLKGSATATLRYAQAFTLNDVAPGAASDAVAIDNVTLTLKAGEVARFNKLGQLEGVFLGSLSGKGRKTGDYKALLVPAGVNQYPAGTVVFEGGNVLGRTGTLLSDFLNTNLPGLRFTDQPDGLVKIVADGVPYYGRLVNGLQVVADSKDGYSVNADMSLSITAKGIRLSFQPALADTSDFAQYMKSSRNYVTQVLDNGLLKLGSSIDTAGFYIARPRYRVAKAADVARGISVAETGSSALLFTSVDLNAQRLEPAFYDEGQVSAAATKMGWTLQTSDLNATIFTVKAPNGSAYGLLPEFRVEKVSDALAAANAGKFVSEGGKLYFYYADQPLRQQLRLK